ncbi:hypothetical protein [Pseudomonas aeruginosa]|uniref:hypothetical protein n=1 Tax=Pseudomonas aeruginosa TaxID=287 RepID=UPI000EB00192|nr:hypothetical protein [Pseudomonas aeruginosa]NNB83919.1 hypothetical protein [Pseudomonas aeruginosa]
MSIIDTILEVEDPREVILFVTRNENGISYPRLDGLYSRHNWVNIGNNLELLKLVSSMVSDGIIIDIGSGLRKGPNWKEPAFFTEKKYSFE